MTPDPIAQRSPDTNDEITLVQTCRGCPEQYDAFIGDEKVAYLRLRHGEFRVDVPACGGKTIFRAEPDGDGSFEADEVPIYLAAAKAAILTYRSLNPS